MIVYKDYYELVESPIFDRYVLSMGKGSFVVILLLLLLGGPFSSITPIISLMIRPYITDPYVKRIFNWLVIFWTWTSGSWAWINILITIEVVRELFRFGLPRFLNRMANYVESSPKTETLFRRLYGVLRRTNRQNAALTMAELYSTAISYNHGDTSGAFNENEKHRFQKIFNDFPSTCFVLDEERRSFTVFFPSFVIKVSPQGIQACNDEALKLIRSAKEESFPRLPSAQPIGSESPSENKINPCGMCQEELGDLFVRLKCNHSYCLNCIFIWLNRQYVCPTCQSEVN